MKFLTFLFLAGLMNLSPLSAEPKATVLWIPETKTVQLGQLLRTVIAMKLPKGWHTYWENPGESGIPLEIKAELPTGWEISPIQYPAPKRFLTGELAGFGYEDQVNFPLTLKPPASFKGEIPPLKIILSWLICNDDACLPGEAELSLHELTDSERISQAYSALPMPLPDAELHIFEKEQEVVLQLSIQGKTACLPLSEYQIFPADPQIVSALANPRFKKDAENPKVWMASFQKNEYFDKIKTPLTFILSAPGKTSWSIRSEK